MEKHPFFTKKYLIFILIGAFLLATVLTVTTLYLANNSRNKTTIPEVAAKSASYITSPQTATVNLPDSSYDKINGGSTSLIYKLPGKSFSVNVSTEKTLIYVAKADGADDTQAVQTQVAQKLIADGLSSDKNGPTNNSGIKYLTYSGNNTICQLVSQVVPQGVKGPHYHELTCVNKSDVQKEYAEIDRLMALDTPQTIKKGFIAVRRQSVTQNSVSCDLVFLTYKDATTSIPLFAEANSKWEYLGDLTAGAGQNSSGNYNITPELNTKINDPKYKGVIAAQVHQ